MEEKSSSSRPSKLHRHFYFDHKNVDTLRHFINPFGQIEVRHRSMSNHQKTNFKRNATKISQPCYQASPLFSFTTLY